MKLRLLLCVFIAACLAGSQAKVEAHGDPTKKIVEAFNTDHDTGGVHTHYLEAQSQVHTPTDGGTYSIANYPNGLPTQAAAGHHVKVVVSRNCNMDVSYLMTIPGDNSGATMSAEWIQASFNQNGVWVLAYSETSVLDLAPLEEGPESCYATSKLWDGSTSHQNPVVTDTATHTHDFTITE